MARRVWNGSSWQSEGGDGGSTNVALVGATVDDLGTPADGSLGLIRVGTWPNVVEELLVFNEAEGVWVGEEITAITTSDAVALDIGDRSGANLTVYGPVKNPIPYGRTYTVLNGAQDVSGATLNVGSAANFAASGLILIRDNVISYTGKTSNTFTGCASVSGSGGTVPSTVDVVQGYAGGYGPVCSPLARVQEFYAAGLTLQEQMTALMNCEPGGVHAFTIAPYWFEVDAGDGDIAITVPPTGGVGLSAPLVSALVDGGSKAGERYFTWAENQWSAWVAGTPTKRYLVPRLVGKMAAGSIDTGECLDVTLRMRWVGVPS